MLKKLWLNSLFLSSLVWAEPGANEEARCHGRSKSNDSHPMAMSLLVLNLQDVQAGSKVVKEGYLLNYKNSATLQDPEPKDLSGPFSVVPVKWDITMVENEGFGKGPTISEIPPLHFIASTSFMAPANLKQVVKIDNQGRGSVTFVNPDGSTNVTFIYDCDYDLYSNERRK